MTLPVLLPLAHNWTVPVRRQLRWPTAVLGAYDGGEQRVALAATPAERITYRTTFLDSEAGGRLLAAVWAAPDLAVRVPRWSDSVRLTAAAGVGATVLPCDPAHRAFAPGAPVLLWASETRYETATVASVEAGGVTLTDGTAAAWPAGAQLVPLVDAWLVAPLPVERYGGPFGECDVTVEVLPDLAGIGTGGEAVDVVPASITLVVAERENLIGYRPLQRAVRAIARDATGAELPAAPCTWSSSNAAVFTVHGTGRPDEALVRFGPTAGTATLTCTCGGVSVQATVQSVGSL